MLTRLRVQNFKNLRDVEVYFGPLTVMAGPNGVGKSNLLDAIQFLGNTAAMTLTQAALKVRSKDANNTDVRKLFFADGGGEGFDGRGFDLFGGTEFLEQFAHRDLANAGDAFEFAREA